MNGTTHKAIGVATGFVVASVGLANGMTFAPMALIAAPVGAMFPDVDHDMTKLGRKRKAVTDFLKIAVPIAVVLFLTLVFVEYYKSRNIVTALVKVGFIVGPIVLMLILSKIPALKKQWDWGTKHRGFMHTLVIPVTSLVVVFTKLRNPSLQWVVIGFVAGYISHLFADSLTTDKCPLLWPFTTKPVGIPICNTRNKSEQIVGYGICVIEACIAVVTYVGFDTILNVIRS